MKPIKLTLQGLHSFREKQVIDFASLCEGGVFGIFGPTGSGKSSILDAMTLSLYGKVERAPGNTQGILNHAEDTLAVSLTFLLGKSTYKVERTFKRTKDDGLRQATARFIDMTSEEVVKADKALDVSKEVEKLLGLSSDDFTRAVVLPQGKFSEFLSLKGTERRQMLQRLFHLEKYGDQLNHKLRQRLTATKHDIALVEKEQVGLGDASAETFEAAKEKVSNLKSEMKKQEKDLDTYQHEYEKSKQQKEWIDELALVEADLQELKKKTTEIEEKKRDIILAKEANILLPYVKEVEESREEIHRLDQKEAEAKEEITVLYEKLKNMEFRFNKAQQDQQNHELPLKIELEKLNALKNKADDLDKRKQQAELLQETVNELTSSVQELEKNQAEKKSKRKRYEDAQKGFKEELAAIQWSSEEKQLLNKANERKFALHETERKLTEIQTQSEKRKLEHDDAINRLKKANAQQTNEKKALEKRFQQIIYWYNIVAEKKNQLNTVIYEIKESKTAHKDIHLQLAAAQMRESLQEGHPCPVCGSSHHVINDTDDHIASESNENMYNSEELSDIESNIEIVEKDLSEMNWRLDQAARQCPIDPEIASSLDTDVVEKSLELLPPFEGEGFKSAFNTWVFQCQKENESISRIIKQWEEQTQAWTRLENTKNEKQLIFNQVKARYEETLTDVEKVKLSYDSKLKDWDKDFPEHPYNQIDEQLALMQKKEEETEILRGRIEKSVPHIEQIQHQLDHLAEELQKKAIIVSEKKSELKEKLNTIEELNQEIETVTKGKSLDNLVAKKQALLEQIVDNLETVKTQKDSLEEQVRVSDRHLADCTHSKNEAIARQKRAIKRWEDQQESSSFNEMSDVKEKQELPEIISRWEQQVSDYDNRLRELSLQIKQLKAKLKDKPVSNQSLTEKKTLFLEAKQKLEQLRTSFGASTHYLEEITRKRERYEQLEKNRLESEKLLNQLAKLDKVFRGKEFVEFVAEEQLVQVSRLASDRLRALTRGRYAIEVDSGGGFIMRDDANGGVKRPVTTLSGGETFLTSLALALSLSASIQLKGEHALEFFFLDEGFGTLDPELLETVVTALEQLHTDRLSVGVISHVPELKERLPRKISVTPAEPGGKGSIAKLESL